MPTVHVLEVSPNLANTGALWTFDTAVSAVTSPAGALRINGSPSNDGASKFSAFVVLTLFVDGVNSGDEWSVDPTSGGVTFVGGATLTAQTGTVS